MRYDEVHKMDLHIQKKKNHKKKKLELFSDKIKRCFNDNLNLVKQKKKNVTHFY